MHLSSVVVIESKSSSPLSKGHMHLLASQFRSAWSNASRNGRLLEVKRHEKQPALRVLKATPTILRSGSFEWLHLAVQFPRYASPRHAWLSFSRSSCTQQQADRLWVRDEVARSILLPWLTVYLLAHMSSCAWVRSLCSQECKRSRRVWALQTWAGVHFIRSGSTWSSWPDLEKHW